MKYRGQMNFKVASWEIKVTTDGQRQERDLGLRLLDDEHKDTLTS